MAIEVLVVDDSAVMRKVIEKTIKICGLQNTHLHEATNGREGLDILENNRVDLLLIDINMPVMDGMRMLQEVRKREHTKELPVLIVSAESNESRIEEIERRGAVFIHKPFTPEKLRGEMLNVIEKKKYSPSSFYEGGQ